MLFRSGYARVSERLSPAENAEALAKFLDIPSATAAEIMSIHYLFSD